MVSGEVSNSEEESDGTVSKGDLTSEDETSNAEERKKILGKRKKTHLASEIGGNMRKRKGKVKEKTSTLQHKLRRGMLHPIDGPRVTRRN